MGYQDVKLISGRATRYLAERIADVYGQELTEMEVQEFSDGEFEPVIQESVRGSYVFIIQSTFAPSENLMELLRFPLRASVKVDQLLERKVVYVSDGFTGVESQQSQQYQQ